MLISVAAKWLENKWPTKSSPNFLTSNGKANMFIFLTLAVVYEKIYPTSNEFQCPGKINLSSKQCSLQSDWAAYLLYVVNSTLTRF